MNINQVRGALIAAYGPTPDSQHQPLMIWGAPGLGKSDGAKQATQMIARAMAVPHTTKKNRPPPPAESFGFIDLRLAQMAEVDLRGFPMVDKESGVTHWTRPEWFPTSGAGIIVLEEIVQSPQSMQAVASQLILDRRIGNHILPPGWMVIATGNRLSDRSATHAMPKHIANRFVHIYAEVSLEAWVAWALEAAIDIRIIAFLKWMPKHLHAFDPQNKGEAFPTPRSWAFVSTLLSAGRISDPELLSAMIKGAVGEGPAGEFIAFMRVFDKMIAPETILMNPKSAPIPDDPSTLWMVVTALESMMTVDNIDKIVIYFNRITEEAKRPEYSIVAMKTTSLRDTERLDGKKLGNTRAFIEWSAKHHELLV